MAFVRLSDAGGRGDAARPLRRRDRQFKVPERIVEVDEFPIVDGPNGVKIRKVELRDRAAALLG